MLDELKTREAEGRPIHVGLVGLGSMGSAIAYQIGRTPGMRLAFVADKDEAAAMRGAEKYGKPTHITSDCLAALGDEKIECDVFIEATNSIIAAYDYCLAAIERNAHCVLMNAEVDLCLGRLLQAEAKKHDVVGRCDSHFQQGYLDYYKVCSKHPYSLFFRPYHLCHLETPRAVALAALYGKAVCTQRMGRVTDCFVYAKKDMSAGARIHHAIGSDEVYGLIDVAKTADASNHVPQAVLDVEDSNQRPVTKRAVKRDQPLTWDDVEIPAGRMADLWENQKRLFS